MSPAIVTLCAILAFGSADWQTWYPGDYLGVVAYVQASESVDVTIWLEVEGSDACYYYPDWSTESQTVTVAMHPEYDCWRELVIDVDLPIMALGSATAAFYIEARDRSAEATVAIQGDL